MTAAIAHNMLRMKGEGLCGNLTGIANPCTVAGVVTVFLIIATLSCALTLIFAVRRLSLTI